MHFKMSDGGLGRIKAPFVTELHFCIFGRLILIGSIRFIEMQVCESLQTTL